MSKLKIILIVLAVASTFLSQCQCHYTGNNPAGSFGSTKSLLYLLMNVWSSGFDGSAATYDFKDDGKLVITKAETDEITKATWSLDGEVLTIIIKEEVTVYSVIKISDDKVQLVGDELTFVLTRVKR